METLAAVGLASNVLQFVDFTTNLIRTLRELRNNTASAENQDHHVITTHFHALSQGINTSVQAISRTSSTLSPEDKALQPVADGCCELAKKLLKRLETCGIQPGQTPSRFYRGKKAFKAVWSKKEIDEISSRLQYFRSELTLHLTNQINKTQVDQQAHQSTKDDIKVVLDKLNDLHSPIESLKHTVEGPLEAHRSEFLDSINELRTENRQLHSQAAQQALSGPLGPDGLNRLQSSMENMNISLQDILTNQSRDSESIAEVKVQNSEFHAWARQQAPLASHSDASFKGLLKGFFDEYTETALTEIKKEFRGTARLELEDLKRNFLQAMNKMQSRVATEGSSRETANEKPRSEPEGQVPGLEETPIKLQSETPDGHDPRELKKQDISVTYSERWGSRTRLGTFVLQIRHKVLFKPSQPVASVYELGAHFLPSPCWLSGGCSMTYQKMTDPRGNPDFGLRFQTYGILDQDHEVWNAIKENKMATIQNMLSQKVISPSDRSSSGVTLLHHAVRHGRLDICKALVQSGADVNISDVAGLSPLEYAFLPAYLIGNKRGRAIFHYLYTLSNIDISVLWLNENLVGYIISNTLSRIGGEGGERENVAKFLCMWQSTCRAVDFDFNVPGSLSFLERLVMILAFWRARAPRKPQHYFEDDTLIFMEDNGFRCAFFEAAYFFNISGDRCPDIPVALAAIILAHVLDMAKDTSAISREKSPILSVQYYCYYVHWELENILVFLEFVISLGIKRNPECIFDSPGGVTVLGAFQMQGWVDIWSHLMSVNDIDWRWAWREDERRKRVTLGKTSAHEITFGVDMSEVHKVKRRKGDATTDGLPKEHCDCGSRIAKNKNWGHPGLLDKFVIKYELLASGKLSDMRVADIDRFWQTNNNVSQLGGLKEAATGYDFSGTYWVMLGYGGAVGRRHHGIGVFAFRVKLYVERRPPGRCRTIRYIPPDVKEGTTDHTRVRVFGYYPQFGHVLNSAG
ncbi:hypothetical protein F4779DRAFT_581650 [Xylariaceae sp. FL0662B]|nr:hypothetical protein F4779DRAFT_581650 [Xylariaceae sp. FL0662B]